ncbi:DMT family transporter [Antarctobacter sp.]|uniref:DMT family transporter n=1 Tax=Antarctobacter sp. TaxID=1872577 RepID=UPI003A912168
MRPATLGICALLGTAILWGSNHVVARAANGIVPLAAFVFWRWALALPIMLAIAWPSIRRHRALIRSHWRDLCVIGTLGVGLFSALLVAGAYHSRAVEVSMINATTPAWVALMTLRHRDTRLGGLQWAGLSIAMLGTLLIIARGDLMTLTRIEARTGNFMALCAAILFAWFSIRLRRYSGHLPAFTLTTVTAAFGTAVVSLPYFLVAVCILGQPIVAAAPDSQSAALLIVLYCALGPTLIGNVFFIYGLSEIGPQRAAAFLYAAPIASSVLATVFLGEVLRPYHFLGYAAILTGLIMVNRRPAEIRAGAPDLE